MVHKTGRSDRGPCGSLLFWHGMVQSFSVQTVQSGPSFKTLVHTSLGCQFLDFLKYWLRGNFELYASERSLLDLKDIFD